MRLLFLSIGDIPSLKHHEIYPDLLREFIKKSYDVYVVCAREKKTGLPTELIEENGAKLLKVHIGNITKSGLLEKGVATITVGTLYKAAIRKYFAGIKFDLIVYSTPPITLAGVIRYIKNRDGAKTYLLLKDIFPQNAVDIGIISTTGIKGLMYKYFRNQEKELYAVSDRIGCMSQANVDYLLAHNSEVGLNKVEICPNSIEIIDKSVDNNTRNKIRLKYDVPLDKTVFIYGGNLGKPQGIPFVIECLRKCTNLEEVYFLIIGDGTEFSRLERYINTEKPKNVKLMRRLPKDDYDNMVGACDIGLLFLDYRFSIPNFPSRVLSYMAAKIPVLACTDPNTDIGKVITEGGFGWSCSSNNVDEFELKVRESLSVDRKILQKNSWDYLVENYSSHKSYEIINSFIQ